MAAIRTKDSNLAAQYARLRPRRGHKKALGAVKHSLICIIWQTLPKRQRLHRHPTGFSCQVNTKRDGGYPGTIRIAG